jgi:hypothetical protein
VIPSTWRENGVGIAGTAGIVSYRGLVVNGFDGVGGGPSNAGGFTAASGLRGGRQNGSAALVEDIAVAGRIDVEIAPGIVAGGAAYTGGSGQGNSTGTDEIDARVTLLDAHADVRWHGWQARALLVRGSVDEAELLNAARSLTGDDSIGSELLGWYLEGGYDLLRLTESQGQLIAFARYEALDTQHEVPSGFSRDPANERTVTTIGGVWRPISNVSLKADFQLYRNEAESGVNQFNLATGYLF